MKTLRYIPSYEESLEMVSKDDGSFYEVKNVVDGYEISVFNYRFAQFNDFMLPLENKPNVRAHELRGLTFVFNKDGSLYKRYILLGKFFNINQVPDSMYSVVKDYDIKFVNNKEDGSVASFIKLPNGKVIGKTKMGFGNDQFVGINRVYNNNKDIKKFVDWSLDNNIVAVFEYVAPDNRIVLKYDKEELILLSLRNNLTGEYLDTNDYLDKIGDVKIAPFENYSNIDELLELSTELEDKEGWVVTFTNGFRIKIKTKWYFDLHNIITDDINRENIVIGYIINEEIDDILSQLPENEDLIREKVGLITDVVSDAIKEKALSIKKSYDIFVSMDKNRKEYALKYRGKDDNFSYVMNVDNGKDAYDLAKEYILDKTSKLLMARNFLEDRGFYK